jgi:hypothetical protein
MSLKKGDEKMIYTGKFAAACAGTAALLWVFCSALVVVMPQTMMQMTAHMIHLDLPQMSWAMSWSGFLLGLLSWAALSGIAGAVLASVYNQLLASGPQ